MSNCVVTSIGLFGSNPTNHRSFDENSPKYEALNNRFYQLIVNSKFRKSLEKKWGSQLFVIADLSLKTFQPTILEDLQKENKLIN